MGKILIINGADFSVNKLDTDVVVTWTPTSAEMGTISSNAGSYGDLISSSQKCRLVTPIKVGANQRLIIKGLTTANISQSSAKESIRFMGYSSAIMNRTTYVEGSMFNDNDYEASLDVAEYKNETSNDMFVSFTYGYLFGSQETLDINSIHLEYAIV